jgi:sugar fermentation stimulation protein A
MKFETPLIEAKLIKRYKRFLADIELPDGKIVVAHVANPGSMKGVSDAGIPCRVSISPNPNRKLRHSLEMVQIRGGHWVGVNTSITNKLVREAYDLKIIADWKNFTEIKAEVKISAESRLDFLLTSPKINRYVEVKNVSMATPPLAMFPDAVTKRGQKHLKDLLALTQQNFEAEIFYVIQREDCHTFRPCDEIDPSYGRLLREVAPHVTVRCWSCIMNKDEIKIHREIKVDLS